MSQEQLSKLAKIIRNGWKEIANHDGEDCEEMKEIAKGILDELEKFESANEGQ